MGVLVEEVVEVLPHVVRRLFVEFFALLCSDALGCFALLDELITQV